MLRIPPPTRVPLGTLQVGNQKVELVLSSEWARYFEALNTQVQTSSSVLAQSVALTAFMGEAGEMPDTFPGPPGDRGAEGAPGLALFMLQDDVHEDMPFVPPSVDGVYVPLNSKDAAGGVPGLTQFKLNLKNVAGTITSWLSSAATAARTWTMPDKDGTVAVLSDFSAPPAIGSVTPAAGKFTSLNTTGSASVGAGAGGIGLNLYGDTLVGSAVGTWSGGALKVAMGNKSAIDGGAYDATAYLWSSGPLVTSGALQVTGGWGCNGKAAQGPAASGGTLAGVIAALVANGILSS